jgi:hypothetical protein
MRSEIRYLRTPDDVVVDGLGVAIEVELLGAGVVGLVLFHVRGVFVVPTVPVYEPTEGAVTVPWPCAAACASAAVLETARAVANAIVVSFMIVFLFPGQHTTAPPLDRSAALASRKSDSGSS